MEIDFDINIEQNASQAGVAAVSSPIQSCAEGVEAWLTSTASIVYPHPIDDIMPLNVRALLGTILITAFLMGLVVIATGIRG